MGATCCTDSRKGEKDARQNGGAPVAGLGGAPEDEREGGEGGAAARGHWQKMGIVARLAAQATPPKKFAAADAVGGEAVAEEEDEHFQALMASWKPGGGAPLRSDAATAAGRQERPSATKAHAEAESSAPPTQAPGATTRSAARVEAPPPPSQDVAVGETPQGALDDIAASRLRMQEALGKAQHRSNSAAVKVQKVFRGRSQRKALESWMGAREPQSQGAGELEAQGTLESQGSQEVEAHQPKRELLRRGGALE